MSAAASEATSAVARQRRNAWINAMHQWHWISAAISLAGMLLFAVTGVTLNTPVKSRRSRIELVWSVEPHTFANCLIWLSQPAKNAHSDSIL